MIFDGSLVSYLLVFFATAFVFYIHGFGVREELRRIKRANNMLMTNGVSFQEEIAALKKERSKQQGIIDYYRRIGSIGVSN